MTCLLCLNEISPRQKVEFHHPIYKSRGGKKTAPCHRKCHRKHHSQSGDFRAWGIKGAASKRWAFHLKNVRNHSAYDDARWHYLMNHADAGWGAGLVM